MNRSNAKSRRLRHRPSRTIPATIVALVLTAIGVLAAVAGIARLVNKTWPSQVTGPAGTVSGAAWGSAGVIVAGIVVALLGLILLIAGIKLGGFKTARLSAPDGGDVGDTDYVISTRAIAKLAASRADTVDGVDKVSVSASGARVHLHIATNSEQTTDISDRVRHTVAEVLTATGISPMPRITASVRTKGI